MPVLQVQEFESLKQKLTHIGFEVKEVYEWIDNLERINKKEQVNNILRQADELNVLRRNLPKEMISEQGNQLMEKCRAEAIDRGIAITEEKEAAIGD